MDLKGKECEVVLISALLMEQQYNESEQQYLTKIDVVNEVAR